MQVFSAAPGSAVRSLWQHRSLIRALIKREVVGRYQGSVMGIVWSFLNPLFMLGVYTFVFSVVFKARWGGGEGSKTEFALVLFAGLIVFNLFAECVTRAPNLILAHANYVKKVVFPLEILPVVSLGAAFFHAAISLLVWLVFYVLLFGWPQPSALLLPLIFAPLMLMTLGASWALASLGVYLRDVGQLIGLVMTVLMFLSPIFYPLSALPVAYQPLLALNPLAPAIEWARTVLYWGQMPDIRLLGVYWALTALTAWGGYAWFQKTRKGFADVL
ncbi:MAG: ABC transporter permease [Burkholderiaceae bacterium]